MNQKKKLCIYWHFMFRNCFDVKIGSHNQILIAFLFSTHSNTNQHLWCWSYSTRICTIMVSFNTFTCTIVHTCRMSWIFDKMVQVQSKLPGKYVSLRPVHHLRKSLSERHPKRGWTARAHQARAGVSLPNFLPFPRIVGGPVRGICEFDTLFSIFSCFWYPKRDTRITRRVVKIYPFYAFLFMRMMYRPQWDIPPGSKLKFHLKI